MEDAFTSRIQPFEWQTAPVLATYRERFAGTAEADAGADLLAMLARHRVMGEEASGLALLVAGTSVGTLEKRTESLEQILDTLGHRTEGAGLAWQLAQQGQPPEEAAREVLKLTEALADAGLRSSSQQADVLKAGGEHAATLLPGWPLRLLKAHVPAQEVVEAMRQAAEVLGPLITSQEMAQELKSAMLAPLGQPWQTELAMLRDTLAILNGPADTAGAIREEAAEVVIGGVRLERR